MCSFGNDWLLAFILCSKTVNQPRATWGPFEASVLLSHLLISQPSHLLNNYSVFFLLSQKPSNVFSSLSVFLPGAYKAFEKENPTDETVSFVSSDGFSPPPPPSPGITSTPDNHSWRAAKKSPSLSACHAVFLPAHSGFSAPRNGFHLLRVIKCSL